jgi:hypothetical protein
MDREIKVKTLKQIFIKPSQFWGMFALLTSLSFLMGGYKSISLMLLIIFFIILSSKKFANSLDYETKELIIILKGGEKNGRRKSKRK